MKTTTRLHTTALCLLSSVLCLLTSSLFGQSGTVTISTSQTTAAYTLNAASGTHYIISAGVQINVLPGTTIAEAFVDPAGSTANWIIDNYGIIGPTDGAAATGNAPYNGIYLNTTGLSIINNYGIIMSGRAAANRAAVNVTGASSGSQGTRVFNFGYIAGAGGAGVRFIYNAPGNYVENSGTIIGNLLNLAAAQAGVDAVRGSASINNLSSGYIAGDGWGVRFLGSAAGSNYLVTNSGTILATGATGDAPAILVSTNVTTGQIHNRGFLQGRSGVIVQTINLTLTNTAGGRIIGTAALGLDLSGANATVINDGLASEIRGVTTGINLSAAGASLTNSNSALITGATALNLSGANATIINDGAASVIRGATIGINIAGLGSTITNSNGALVIGDNYGIQTLAASNVTINNTGGRVTGTSGVWAAGITAINNTGLISGTGATDNDAGIRGTSTGVVTLENSGTVTGGGKGVMLGATDGQLVTNLAGGEIISTAALGAHTTYTGGVGAGIAFSAAGAHPVMSATVNNAGLISGANHGIFSANGMEIHNTGTIRATGLQIASVYFAGTNAAESSLTLGTGAVLDGNVLSAKSTGNRIFLEGSGATAANFLGVDSTVGANNAFVAAHGFESLAMNGAAWTLSGTLAITGAAANALSLNSGTLTLSGALLTPNNAGIALNGGALVLDYAGNATFATPVSGAGNLLHAGSGLLNLTGANTYTGVTTVLTGTLKGDIGASSLHLDTAAATYVMDPAATVANLANITGIGVVDIQNANLVFNIVGATSIQTFAFPGTLTSGGTSKLIKEGAGKLVLAQSLAAALSGGAEVRNGILSLANTSYINTSGLVLGGGAGAGATAGLIEYTGPGAWNINVTLAGAGGGFHVTSGTQTLAINVAGSGAFVKDGAGGLDIRGSTLAATVNATQVRNGALIASNATLRGPVTLVTAASTLVYDQPGPTAVTDNRAMSGAGGLVKTGAGLLNLTGAITYTGNTIVREGTLQGGIGSGGLQVDLGATYKVADGVTSFQLSGISGAGNVDLNAASLILNVAAGASDVFNFSGNLISANPASKLVKTGAGVTSLLSPVVLQGGVEVQNGVLRLANQSFITTPIVLGAAATAGLIEYTGAAAWTHDITLAAGGGGGFSVATGAQTLSGFAINGSGNFVKAGPGSLDITGASVTDTAHGAVRVLDGALRGSASTLKQGGITLESASATVEFNQTGAPATYASAITGPGSLIKTGPGDLALTGANSYNNTEIREGLLSGNIGAGQLVIGASGTYRVAAGATDYITTGVLGNGNLDLGGASLVFNVASGVSAHSFAGALTGGNQLVKAGAGTLDLLSAIALPNGAVIREGVVRLARQDFLNSPVILGSDTAAGFLEYTSVVPWTPAVILAGEGGGFVVNGAAEIIVHAPITSTGAAPFIKDGPGALNITGATLSGVSDVQVRGGLLRGDAAALASANAAIAAGATYELRHDAPVPVTFSGATSGSGDFLKSGAGVMRVTGALNHTGFTRIQQGRLVIGAAGVLPAAANVLIAEAGALDIGYLNQTIAGLYNTGAIYINATVNSRAGIVFTTGQLTVNGPATGSGQILVRLAEEDTRYPKTFPSSAIIARFAAPVDYTFDLAERAVDGPYEWNLLRSGNNVVLAKGQLSPEVPAAAGIDAGAYLAGKSTLASLAGRLAGQRLSSKPGDPFQVWAQWLRYQDTLDETLYKKASAKTDGIQAGAEWNLGRLRGGNDGSAASDYQLLLGVHYDATKSTVKIPGGISWSDTESGGLGVYGSYRSEGLYVDLMLRNAKNKFAGTVYYGEPSRFRATGYSMAAAVEVGGLLPFKSPWKVEPQVRLAFQRHTIDPFVDGMGRRIEIASEDSREGRVAMRLFREFSFVDRGYILVPQMRASLAYEGKSGARVNFTDPAAPGSFGNSRVGAVAMMEAGLVYMVRFGFRFQADAAYYEGAKIRGHSLHLSAGYSW